MRMRRFSGVLAATRTWEIADDQLAESLRCLDSERLEGHFVEVAADEDPYSALSEDVVRDAGYLRPVDEEG